METNKRDGGNRKKVPSLSKLHWKHKQSKTNKMYRQITKPNASSIKVNDSYKGERLEEKIQRIVNNGEPITDGAPLIYQEREKGVEAQYNIRTDRMEIALDAMDKVSKTHLAKREDRIGQKAMKNMTEEQKQEYVKTHPNVQYTPPAKPE